MHLLLATSMAYVASPTPTPTPTSAPSQTNLNVKIPMKLLSQLQKDANVYILGTADSSSAYVSSTSALFVSRVDINRIYAKTSTASNFKLMVPFQPLKVTLISLNPTKNQICLDTAMNNAGIYGSTVEFPSCTLSNSDVVEFKNTIELAIQASTDKVKQFPVKSY